MLIHSGWPWLEEGAYVASILPQVYLEMSITMPWASFAIDQKLEVLLGAAPPAKVLYGSDEATEPEVIWLSAQLGREALGRVLGTAVERGWLDAGRSTRRSARASWPETSGGCTGSAAAERSVMLVRTESAQLRLVELEQEAPKLGEALRSEPSFPIALDLADGVSHGVPRQLAAPGEGDALGASVVRICPALEIAESFELAEEIVDCLLAHASSGRDLGGSCPLGPRVQQDVQVGRVQVVESLFVQPLEHPPLHLFPGHPQESADQRWPQGLLGGPLSKAT